MNAKVYEEARDFAGADWMKLSDRSKEIMLEKHGMPQRFAIFSWWSLPASVKDRLTRSLIRDRKDGIVQRKERVLSYA